MKKCHDCGKDSVQLHEANSELLEVCQECGSSRSNIGDQLTHQSGFEFSLSPQKKKLNYSNKHGIRNTVFLSNQKEGFIKKRVTRVRKDVELCLKTSLDRLSLKGSIANEAINLLSRVNLVGRSFKKECLSAACIFVALRTHESDFELSKLAQKLDVDFSETNRAVKYFQRRPDIKVKVANFEHKSVEEVLKHCEFCDEYGTEIPVEQVIQRVDNFMELLLVLPISSARMTENIILATTFLLYKFQHLRRRPSFKFQDFVRECNLNSDIVDKCNSGKSIETVQRWIKILAQRLPYFSKTQSEVKAMKSQAILAYIGDIEKHRELILNSFARSTFEAGRVVEEKNKIDANDEDDLGDVSDEETSCYLRTKEEIEILTPLYDALYNSQ